MKYRFNDDFFIYANTRCGSTSMYDYFNIRAYSLDNFENKHSIPFPEPAVKYNILILRNPYDRIRSALNATKYLHKLFGADQNPNGNFYRSVGFHTWVINHSQPFLYYFGSRPQKDLYIIDFYELDKYVGKPSIGTLVSKAKRQRGWHKDFIPYYTRHELSIEYQTYKYLLSTYPKLSVDKWKQLTNSVRLANKATLNYSGNIPENSLSSPQVREYEPVTKQDKGINHIKKVVKKLKENLI